MNKLSMAIACTLALAALTRAQESKSADSETLEEVTVLADRARAATKTDTLLTETPQSISVVTEEQIVERGAVYYQDVFRYSAGVGIAWNSPIGPLKFSYAIPLNAREGDRQQRFQFQAGTAF